MACKVLFRAIILKKIVLAVVKGVSGFQVGPDQVGFSQAFSDHLESAQITSILFNIAAA